MFHLSFPKIYIKNSSLGLSLQQVKEAFKGNSQNSFNNLFMIKKKSSRIMENSAVCYSGKVTLAKKKTHTFLK